MSLERTETNTLVDEKNPLDTSSSVNMLSNSIFARRIDDFYSPDVSVDMYTLKIPLESQRSSLNYSNNSKNSDFFKYLEENDRHECDSKLTTIEKNIPHNYKILIESVQEDNTLTPCNGNNGLNVPLNKCRNSTIYTNLSSDSSQVAEIVSPRSFDEGKKENLHRDVRISKGKPLGISRPGVSLRGSTFALTNRILCNKCGVETLTDVSFQMKDMNLWGSIGFFFTAIKCCGEPRALSRYQEIVHSCKKCGSVLAKISSV